MSQIRGLEVSGRMLSEARENTVQCLPREFLPIRTCDAPLPRENSTNVLY